jgi:hypothetical protein
MTLVKRWDRERNQRRRKMLRMSNTESSTSPGGALVGLAPPFGFWGGVVAIEVSSGEGERMRSTDMGEDMVV